MKKLTPQDIALRATGEAIDPQAQEQLDTSKRAQQELESLREVVARARRKPITAITEPPAALWQNIASSLESESAASAPTPTPIPMARQPRRHRWSALMVAGAAAAGIVVVFTIASLSMHSSETKIAEIQLASGKNMSTTGTATVLKKDGSYLLDVHLKNAAVSNSDYMELWLIKADGSGLISLGPAKTQGTYAVPASVDLAAFPIVDVSDEPSDGNPAHSSKTMCRGTLKL